MQRFCVCVLWVLGNFLSPGELNNSRFCWHLSNSKRKKNPANTHFVALYWQVGSISDADINISAGIDKQVCAPRGLSDVLFYLRSVIDEQRRWLRREGRGRFNRDIPTCISLLLFDRQDRELSNGHYDNNFPVGRQYGIVIRISLNVGFQLGCPFLSNCFFFFIVRLVRVLYENITQLGIHYALRALDVS